jgi:tRNA(fMet)-specific endonuclease VapC
MSLCLDSSTIVEMLRAKPNLKVRTFFQEALGRGEPVWIGAVVVHELMSGALRSERAPEQLQRLDDVLARLNIAELSADDAVGAARACNELEKRGARLGTIDALVAGQALARDWTLVTCELGAFMRVQGLKLMDWTRSDQPLDRPDILAQMLRRNTEEDK